MTALRPASPFRYNPFTDYDTAAPAVRAADGVSCLSPARAAEVRAAVAKHAERAARKATCDPPSWTMMNRLRARLAAQVQAAVEPLMDDLFRAAQSSWAGGETEDRVRIGSEPHAEGATFKVWSRNGKWSGTDLRRTVTVMPGWRKAVRDRGLATLDGMLTTHVGEALPTDGPIAVYPAAWVRQGRGYDLVAESGFLAVHRGTGTAYHATGRDAATAFRGLARKLQAQVVPVAERIAAKSARAVAKAERQAAALGRLVERLARWDLAEIEHVVVTRADSLRAGNCQPGTDAFIDRLFPDRDPDGQATIGEIAARVGRLDLATLKAADLELGRQLAAACLHAVRRDKAARRLVGA